LVLFFLPDEPNTLFFPLEFLHLEFEGFHIRLTLGLHFERFCVISIY